MNTFFVLGGHVRLALFRDELICLDLCRDKYIFFNPDHSKLISFILSAEFSLDNKKEYHARSSKNCFGASDLNLMIYSLIEENLIVESSKKKLFNLSRAEDGMFQLNWREKFSINDKTRFLSLCDAILSLIKAYCLLKTKGFYATTSIIRKNKPEKTKVDQYKIVCKLASALDKALLFFPKKTKCLEWSIALMLMCQKRKIDVSLVIGVQNYPFKAHAWIQYKGKIIADHQDLAKNLSIIYMEPRV